MIAMQHGVRPAQAIEALREAARSAGDAIGAPTPQQMLTHYRTWAVNQIRALRPLVTAAELDRLVTTRRYWAVDSGVDYSSPASYGSPILEELTAQKELLEREGSELAATVKRWGAPNSLALVLDTSVFAEHGGGFADLGWHARTRQNSNTFIYVVVTMAVVRELDGKKLNRDTSPQGRKVRTNVRSALKRIEELFPTNNTQTHANTDLGEGVVAHANIALLTDVRGHEPLAVTDAEVIERGLSLLPFVDAAALVTYDVNQAFSARSAGLGGLRLKYDYETEA